MNLETKIIIYKFTPQVFTLTRTRSTLFIELCSLCIYVGYIVYIAVYLKMDVAICWTSDIVYYAMIFTSFFYLWKGNWQNKKI